MKISKIEAMNIYNDVKASGTLTDTKKGRVYSERYQQDSFTYDFNFIDGELKKIEQFNHRELIEAWVQ